MIVLAAALLFAAVANDDGTLSFIDRRWVETSPRYFESVDGPGELGFADSAGNVIAASLGSFRVFERVR